MFKTTENTNLPLSFKKKGTRNSLVYNFIQCMISYRRYLFDNEINRKIRNRQLIYSLFIDKLSIRVDGTIKDMGSQSGLF